MSGPNKIEYRKISCVCRYYAKDGKLQSEYFLINEYPSYIGALDIALKYAESLGGKLIVFDSMAYSEALTTCLLNTRKVSSNKRMREFIYLANVVSLLRKLEVETQGYINQYDEILRVMIDETERKMEEFN